MSWPRHALCDPPGGAWLADIAEAITAIERYLEAGTLAEGVVYDACRARLIEIGEAVKHLDPALLQSAPGSGGGRSPGCATNWSTTSTPTTPLSPRAVNEEFPRLRDAVKVLLLRVNEPPPTRPS